MAVAPPGPEVRTERSGPMAAGCGCGFQGGGGGRGAQGPGAGGGAGGGREAGVQVGRAAAHGGDEAVRCEAGSAKEQERWWVTRVRLSASQGHTSQASTQPRSRRRTCENTEQRGRADVRAVGGRAGQAHTLTLAGAGGSACQSDSSWPSPMGRGARGAGTYEEASILLRGWKGGCGNAGTHARVRQPRGLASEQFAACLACQGRHASSSGRRQPACSAPCARPAHPVPCC